MYDICLATQYCNYRLYFYFNIYFVRLLQHQHRCMMIIYVPALMFPFYLVSVFLNGDFVGLFFSLIAFSFSIYNFSHLDHRNVNGLHRQLERDHPGAAFPFLQVRYDPVTDEADLRYLSPRDGFGRFVVGFFA